MSERYFPRVDRWRLAADVLDVSLADMARDGARGNEGVALWLGNRKSGRASVSHVVLLRGPGVRKGPELMVIESWLLNDVTDFAIDAGVCLIGQIHSHGIGYSTSLSETDRKYGVAVPHYLSIVAPDFAQRPSTTIMDCGVHVFETGTGYRRLGTAEVEKRVRIDTSQLAEVITVGA